MGQLPDPKTRQGPAVADMFSAIASTYDFLNHLLSLNVDKRWRRITTTALAPGPGERILDLCTGTGDLAFSLAGRSGARVVGADFSPGMLAVARQKARKWDQPLPLVQADAMALPFSGSSFDGLMVAFGVRNFEDLEAGFREMARVLRPGGRLAILEFSIPDRSLFGTLYRFYFSRVLPRIGRFVSGAAGPYDYLPDTVEGFPGTSALAGMLSAAGFHVLEQRPLTGGVAMLHLGAKAAGSPPADPSVRMAP
jgi:demethylmenaquinone methyltransferase/2-methoxy-6-polyprenyl-1,4-benzoquinol methylase